VSSLITAQLSAIHDHLLVDYPGDHTWTESIWFSWAIPERDITGFVWIHFRPNQNCICGGPAMWDRSGQLAFQFPFFDWQALRKLPAGKWGVDYDKFDFATDWSMDIRMIEPMRKYRIRYDRAGFNMDLTWTAVAPANAMGGEDNADIGADLSRAFRSHFEQPGRIAGFVEVDGERLAVDCFSMRDGGHGPRSMEAAKPGAYGWAIAGEGNAFHYIAPDATGAEAPVVAGFLWRDGKTAPLVSGSRRVIAREGPRPIAVELHARDALGRDLHATGREQVPALITVFPDRGNWWSLYRWDFDGYADALGEDQEYYSVHDLRRWHRAGPEAWQNR
jgi:hypothetical protein